MNAAEATTDKANGGRRGMRTTISRRRSGTVRVLAVLGLLTFGLSVVIVLQEVSDPVADESNLEPAGSPEARMGANHPGETVHVGGAIAVLLIGSSGMIGLVVRNTWPPLADPHHQLHWYTMGVLGFMIVMCVAVVPLGGQGWQVASASAGLGALAIGMISLFAPEAASTQAWPWALAAVGWGLVVLLLTATEGEAPDNSPPVPSVNPETARAPPSVPRTPCSRSIADA